MNAVPQRCAAGVAHPLLQLRIFGLEPVALLPQLVRIADYSAHRVGLQLGSRVALGTGSGCFGRRTAGARASTGRDLLRRERVRNRIGHAKSLSAAVSRCPRRTACTAPKIRATAVHRLVPRTGGSGAGSVDARLAARTSSHGHADAVRLRWRPRRCSFGPSSGAPGRRSPRSARVLSMCACLSLHLRRDVLVAWLLQLSIARALPTSSLVTRVL
eukprot:SAG31_NODE_1832_length_7148_cov_5.322315_3_plen_215_part_00